MALSKKDLQQAADDLMCDLPAIQAVAEVESKGEPFYSDGFPVILFERHKFSQFTEGIYDKSNPRISNPKSGGYSPPRGPRSLAERNEKWQRAKFSEAWALDRLAALKSCSYGRFQIMGFNYKACGFLSVDAFYDAMRDESLQLRAFVNFVRSQGLDGHLRSHNWAKFARGYNGPRYKDNDYDTKMAQAYEKYVTLSSSPAPQAPATESATKPPVIILPVTEDKQDSAGDLSILDRVSSPFIAVKQKFDVLGVDPTKISKSSAVTTIGLKAWGAILMAVSFFYDNPIYLGAATALIVVGAVVFIFAKRNATARTTNVQTTVNVEAK
jgi:hypothetical protein